MTTAPRMSPASSENADPVELAKFGTLAHRWWDPESEMFGPLHKLNPLRFEWIDRVSGGLAGKAVVDVGCGGGILAESMAARAPASSASIWVTRRWVWRGCTSSNRAPAPTIAWWPRKRSRPRRRAPTTS